MKIQLHKLSPVLALFVFVSCVGKDRYSEALAQGKAIGYKEGYDVGYDEGQAQGDEDGYERAKIYFESAGFNEGFNDGRQVGTALGYKEGYTVGKNETYNGAYTNGYNVGYSKGEVNGEARGYDDGYDDGFETKYDLEYSRGYDASFSWAYSRGYGRGKDDGYRVGYSDGEYDGYNAGYDDGYNDGYIPPVVADDDYWYDDDDYYDDDYWYDLSVGKSKKLKGFADVLSLAHNDIFDYTKISKPKVTSRGLMVGGEMILSEVSMTNKDTLKRAAVTEQYLVIEMAKQVKGKFGLSSDRSLKIAKAANHFRKQSSRRSLTSEDTNAYATEILGADFREISKAYEETLKGDISSFTNVLDKAADKNGTSPEKISNILVNYFM